MKLIINYERLSKILIRRIVSLYGESKMIGELSGIFQDKKKLPKQPEKCIDDVSSYDPVSAEPGLLNLYFFQLLDRTVYDITVDDRKISKLSNGNASGFMVDPELFCSV